MDTPTPLHPVATTQAGELPKLPKWIDDLKGSDPRTDELIVEIEAWRDIAIKARAAIEMQASHSAVPVADLHGLRSDDEERFIEIGTRSNPLLIIHTAHPSPTTAAASEDKDAIIKDLSALVNRLSLALKNVAPGHELPQKAGEYLKRKDLTSPLRTLGDRVREANAPAPFPKKGN